MGDTALRKPLAWTQCKDMSCQVKAATCHFSRSVAPGPRAEGLRMGRRALFVKRVDFLP